MRGPEYLIAARTRSRIAGRKQWTVQPAQVGLSAPKRQASMRASE
jgi:hypothetical protein